MYTIHCMNAVVGSPPYNTNQELIWKSKSSDLLLDNVFEIFSN